MNRLIASLVTIGTLAVGCGDSSSDLGDLGPTQSSVSESPSMPLERPDNFRATYERGATTCNCREATTVSADGLEYRLDYGEVELIWRYPVPDDHLDVIYEEILNSRFDEFVEAAIEDAGDLTPPRVLQVVAGDLDHRVTEDAHHQIERPATDWSPENSLEWVTGVGPLSSATREAMLRLTPQAFDSSVRTLVMETDVLLSFDHDDFSDEITIRWHETDGERIDLDIRSLAVDGSVIDEVTEILPLASPLIFGSSGLEAGS